MRPAPPRALVVSQPTSGGVGTAVRGVVEAAVDRGWSTTVACPDEGLLPKWVTAAGATWVELPLRREPGPWDVAHLRRLRRLIADDFDLVHLHSSKAGALGRVALLGLGARRPPCAFTPHGWSWHVGGPLAAGYRLVERLLAPLADAIVAVSSDDERVGSSVLGARARLRTIPNGVDPETFTAEGPVAARSPAPLVVCVGRLDRSKGQDVTIDALVQLTTAGARLRLVGSGPLAGQLEEHARRLGLEDRVEMTGEVDDPRPHLRAADVVVVPSRWDGLSIALLEAMSCGSAVVGTAVPGSSVLRDAGVVVPVEDPHALAAAIDDLLADPRRRAQLGRQARERVLADHDLRRTTAEVLALWAELAPGPAGSRC